MPTNQIIKYFSTQETEKLLAKISDNRDKLMFCLMYYLGLRCSELVGLKLDDLRLDDGRVFIRAAKNGISGEYVLPKECKKLIKEYLPVRELKIKKMRLQTSVLFLSNKGGALTTRQVHRLFQTYCQKARLKDATKHHPHTLRHSIAVAMANSGIPVEVVQIHLRHRKIDSTMVYFQLSNQKRHQLQELALQGSWVARV
jgi:site-specific recombinase XerD